ncbi:MAG: hypothetical protein NTV00_00905 [Methylococcales bacterium]|nr:hypothetical protein [Methylococcales bacterium]
MPDRPAPSPSLNDDLRLPWIITYGMALLLLAYVIVAYSYSASIPAAITLTEEQRLSLRTIFYWLAILTLPLTNLIRHIQLRLNQTMPTATPAKNRYFLTVLVSMALIESIGLYGLLLFYLGDGVNSLFIFSGLSALGLFLYRPKLAEYRSVVEALADKQAANQPLSQDR